MSRPSHHFPSVVSVPPHRAFILRRRPLPFPQNKKRTLPSMQTRVCRFCTFSVLRKYLHVQDCCQNNKKNGKELGRLHKRPFHGTSFILAPVCVGHASDRSQSCLLALLHQNNDCECNTVYSK